MIRWKTVFNKPKFKKKIYIGKRQSLATEDIFIPTFQYMERKVIR